MGRAKWTDERLDDSFDRLDRDLRELRGEMRDSFAEVRSGFGEVRQEIDGLRVLIYRMGGGLFLALFAAIVLRGL
jgi:hypothetical protein